MKDFFYEMIVKSANASELFKGFAFELGVTCVEERGECFIIRDEEDLQNFMLCSSLDEILNDVRERAGE